MRFGRLTREGWRFGFGSADARAVRSTRTGFGVGDDLLERPRGDLYVHACAHAQSSPIQRVTYRSQPDRVAQVVGTRHSEQFFAMQSAGLPGPKCSKWPSGFRTKVLKSLLSSTEETMDPVTSSHWRSRTNRSATRVSTF